MPADLRQQVLDDSSIPAPVRRALESGLALEEIRLDRHGHWWHEQAEIEHKKVSRLFSRSVDRTEGGTYVLQIGGFTYPIVVEDTPYFVTSVALTGEGLHLHLNDGTQEVVEAGILAYDAAKNRLIATIKGGHLTARLLRHAHHSLLDLAHIEADRLIVEVSGRRYDLGGVNG